MMSRWIDSLPPRLCFAGLDPGFGVGGSIDFGTSNEITGVLPTTQGIFVEIEAIDSATGWLPDASTTVRRLTVAGEVDPDWAGDGAAELPFRAASQLAYDQWRNKLIVVGPEGESLQIVRLNADGSRDQTFGDNGIVTYTPASTDDVHLTPDSVNVLRNGGLLLGVTVSSTVSSGGTDDDGLYLYGTSGPVETALVRLHPSGTRDTNSGHRGVKVVASGCYRSLNDSGDIGREDERFSVAAVTPQADGGFSVVMNRRQHDTENVYGETHDVADVVVRTVNANGAFAPAAGDGTWRLHDASWDDEHGKQDEFTPAGVVPGPRGFVAFGKTRQAGAQAYELSAGSTVTTRELAFTEFTPVAVKRVRNGFIVTSEIDAVATRSSAVRLTNSLKPRANWGDQGRLQFDAEPSYFNQDYPVDVVIDPDNRVLTHIAGRLRRYLP